MLKHTARGQLHSKAGVPTENEINGNKRLDIFTVASTSKYTTEKNSNGNDAWSGYIDIDYEKNGKIITVRTYMQCGNIVSVNQNANPQ